MSRLCLTPTMTFIEMDCMKNVMTFLREKPHAKSALHCIIMPDLVINNTNAQTHTYIMECVACTWRKYLSGRRPHRSGRSAPPLKSSSMHKQGAVDDKCSDAFPAIKHFPELTASVWNNMHICCAWGYLWPWWKGIPQPNLISVYIFSLNWQPL